VQPDKVAPPEVIDKITGERSVETGLLGALVSISTIGCVENGLPA
jgi:hypothetical protein